MATQSVEYVSCTRICCGDFPADIIICLPTLYVGPKFCPPAESEVEQPFEYSYIEGQMTSETCIKQGCYPAWKYNITFDDEQLAEGVVLSGTEITGIICKNCFTQWVEELVGDEPYLTVNSGGVQSFVSPHGCEYPIDAITCLEVEDTESIDLTLDVEENGCNIISADAIVSAVEDNILTVEADGLYVPAATSNSPVLFRLHNDLTQEGNTAPGPGAITSYTVVGNTIQAVGDTLFIKATGTTANNTNEKEIELLLGSVSLGSLLLAPEVPIVTKWEIKSEVNLSAVGFIKFTTYIYIASSAVTFDFQGATALDMSVNQDISLEGTAVANNDILKEIFIIDKIAGV